jgi:hypothetical protein
MFAATLNSDSFIFSKRELFFFSTQLEMTQKDSSPLEGEAYV